MYPFLNRTKQTITCFGVQTGWHDEDTRSTCRSSSVNEDMGYRKDDCAEAVLGWISEATWCQQLPICCCVPVKASGRQQACDLAPSTTPHREARPGVTDPLTGCSCHHPPLLHFSLCGDFAQVPSAAIFAAAILCLLCFSFLNVI